MRSVYFWWNCCWLYMCGTAKAPTEIPCVYQKGSNQEWPQSNLCSMLPLVIIAQNYQHYADVRQSICFHLLECYRTGCASLIWREGETGVSKGQTADIEHFGHLQPLFLWHFYKVLNRVWTSCQAHWDSSLHVYLELLHLGNGGAPVKLKAFWWSCFSLSVWI